MNAAILYPLIFASFTAFSEPMPDCLGDEGDALVVDNAQVLLWKTTTKNQFKARARVQGVLVEVYRDKNTHKHFAIQIGDESSDRLEVIYEKSFGPLPDLRPGMQVEACGDYITSTRDSKYPRSPDDAIIHWVHKSNSDHHPSGYVAIDGVAYGT